MPWGFDEEEGVELWIDVAEASRSPRKRRHNFKQDDLLRMPISMVRSVAVSRGLSEEDIEGMAKGEIVDILVEVGLLDSAEKGDEDDMDEGERSKQREQWVRVDMAAGAFEGIVKALGDSLEGNDGANLISRPVTLYYRRPAEPPAMTRSLSIDDVVGEGKWPTLPSIYREEVESNPYREADRTSASDRKVAAAAEAALRLLQAFADVTSDAEDACASHDTSNDHDVAESNKAGYFDAAEAAAVARKAAVDSHVVRCLAAQLRDVMAVTSHLLPEWCWEIVCRCPAVVPLSIRQQLLATYCFGVSRSIRAIASSYNVGIAVPELRHDLIWIERDHFLTQSAAALRMVAPHKTELEIRFRRHGEPEEGVGQGVTDGFYAQLATVVTLQDEIGFWSHRTNGLVFPAPTGRQFGPATPEYLERAQLLGRLIGKVIQQGRRLGVTFGDPFWTRLMGHTISDTHVRRLAPSHVQQWCQRLSSQKRQVARLPPDDRAARLHALHAEAAGSMLSLADPSTNTPLAWRADGCGHIVYHGDWGFPEPDTVYLQCAVCGQTIAPGGATSGVDLDFRLEDAEGLERAVVSWWRYIATEGVEHAMEAIRNGISEVMAVTSLATLTPKELDLCFGGSIEWTAADVEVGVTAMTGESDDFPQLQWVREALVDASPTVRARLLRFVTSVPSLPPGGFKSLVGRDGTSGIKVILRDDLSPSALPLANTCCFFLRVPPCEPLLHTIQRERTQWKHSDAHAYAVMHTTCTAPRGITASSPCQRSRQLQIQRAVSRKIHNGG